MAAELPPRRRSAVVWLAWLVALALVAWLVAPTVRGWLAPPRAEPRAITARGDLADDEQTTIAIFERHSPSVVYITTLGREVDFFTRNVAEVPNGTGSGFLWDELGHVVTNFHVIRGADRAVVALDDGKTYDATLVGASREHDLAVLRIAVPANLPVPLPVGTSADLKVGQKVLAIGNPFGLDHTLTTGVISALGRSIQDEDGRSISGLVQTDAAINPGNSGGPLLDSAGRLIGVNTAIYSPSGASVGIGFAVPVDTINRIVPRLIQHGRVPRPVIGIFARDDISTLIGTRAGITGILVLDVSPGSPAERAGLRATRRSADGGIIPGDMIREVDGHEVSHMADLTTLLEEKAPGDTVKIELWRDGETVELDVGLVAANE